MNTRTTAALPLGHLALEHWPPIRSATRTGTFIFACLHLVVIMLRLGTLDWKSDGIPWTQALVAFADWRRRFPPPVMPQVLRFSRWTRHNVCIPAVSPSACLTQDRCVTRPPPQCFRAVTLGRLNKQCPLTMLSDACLFFTSLAGCAPPPVVLPSVCTILQARRAPCRPPIVPLIVA